MSVSRSKTGLSYLHKDTPCLALEEAERTRRLPPADCRTQVACPCSWLWMMENVKEARVLDTVNSMAFPRVPLSDVLGAALKLFALHVER